MLLINFLSLMGFFIDFVLLDNKLSNWWNNFEYRIIDFF